MTDIHKTAVVEEGAEIGAGTSIGPFAYIEGKTKIGENCRIGPRATILANTELGAECRVHAGAVLGDVPQDLAFSGTDSFVSIGAGCVIREGVTVHRGTKDGSVTRIGDGCFLMGFSHFAHNVQLGNRVIVANGVLLAGYVEVGDGAFISGNVVVHQFSKIGRLAMLGGNCAVSKDVPPFCTLHPVALNQVAGLNVIGMRRAGMQSAERDQVKKAFKILFRSGLNTSEAREKLCATFTSGPASEFGAFLEKAERGICTFGA